MHTVEPESDARAYTPVTSPLGGGVLEASETIRKAFTFVSDGSRCNGGCPSGSSAIVLASGGQTSEGCLFSTNCSVAMTSAVCSSTTARSNALMRDVFQPSIRTDARVPCRWAQHRPAWPGWNRARWVGT